VHAWEKGRAGGGEKAEKREREREREDPVELIIIAPKVILHLVGREQNCLFVPACFTKAAVEFATLAISCARCPKFCKSISVPLPLYGSEIWSKQCDKQ
jgi:hypothetical protein